MKGFTNKYLVYSKHAIFKNKHLIVTCEDSVLCIRVPSLDYNWKVSSTCVLKRTPGARSFCITNQYLRPGKYEIDLEESNEDQIVAYLNEK